MRAHAALIAVAVAACAGRARPAEPASRCGAAVVVAEQADVDALRGCARLGALTIRTGASLDLSPLADLGAVDGVLTVGPTLQLASVSLPALASVGAARITANGGLAAVYLPALRDAGALEVVDNVTLATWSSPALAVVTGDLTIARGGALEVVDLSALATVDGALRLEGVAALRVWLAPALRRIGRLAVVAPGLSLDDLAALDAAQRGAPIAPPR
ncbi:MAG: hypothetical protein R2939_18145 [Kofleriaceae bacterium]